MSPIVDVNEATQLSSGTVLAVPFDSDVVIGPEGGRYVRSNADGYLTAVNENYFDVVLAPNVDSDGVRLFTKDTNINLRSYVTKFYAAPSTYFLQLSMDDPPSTLVNGPGLQLFKMAVRKSQAGVNPLIRVELYEQGTSTLLATPIAQVPVSSLSKTVLQGTWDASVLSDGTGSQTQVRIVSTTIQSGVTVDIASFEWTPTVEPFTGWDSTTITFDSTTITFAD